jgi:hypothetical protein
MWARANRVGTGAFARPAEQSEATRPQDYPEKAHTSSASRTKQDYASRRDQPECSCPEGKSLPLGKAYPAPGCESMASFLGFDHS